MRDPDQVFIFNNAELSLIKTVFADNDALLYTIRKVLLQFPLTDAEKGLLKMSITPEVFRVVKKKILPEIGEEFPLTQLPDLLTTLTGDLKTKSVEDMAPLFAAKKLELDYLAQQFAVLQDVEADMAQPIKLADMAVIKMEGGNGLVDYNYYVRMTAYLFLLGYIDPMLYQLKVIAGAKTETVDEAKARMDKNSNK